MEVHFIDVVHHFTYCGHVQYDQGLTFFRSVVCLLIEFCRVNTHNQLLVVTHCKKQDK